MPNPKAFAAIYFFVTLGCAMILRLMSLGPVFDLLNPDWIMLVMVYWVMALPERFGVFYGFFVGLLTDVLTGRMLGQYALIYAVIAYFTVKEHRRLRQFPILHQCLFVFYFLMFAKLVVFGMESLKAGNRFGIEYWGSAFTGVLAWPLVFVMLRNIRVLARIA